jgi:uncharacterized protein YPO0396
MEKYNWHILWLFLIMAMGVVACSSPSEKVRNAETDVVKAKKALEEANSEYLKDVANHRQLAAARIEENKRIIADFERRIGEDKSAARLEYQKKIKEINARNSDLQKRMDEYKSDSKDSWVKFKSEFNEDMDDLGDALNNFFTKN